MMRVSKQRLLSPFVCCLTALVPGSNTSYGNSLGKAPLIPVKLVFGHLIRAN